MQYEYARNLIRTGDLIAVRRRSGVFAIATRLVTGSPYTHTGVAVWVGGRLLMAHINGAGCSFVPVSHAAEFGFDVYRCPVYRDRVEAVIWATLGKRIKYRVVDLARILLYFWFKFPLPKRPSRRICSSLSAYLYLEAGWLAPGLPSIPWPGAIADALGGAPAIAVRP